MFEIRFINKWIHSTGWRNVPVIMLIPVFVFLASCTSDKWYEPEACIEDCLIIEGQVQDVNRQENLEGIRIQLVGGNVNYKYKYDTLSEAFTDANGWYRFSIPINNFDNRDVIVEASLDNEQYFEQYSGGFQYIEFFRKVYSDVEETDADIVQNGDFKLIPKTNVVYEITPPSGPSDIRYFSDFKSSFTYAYDDEPDSLHYNLGIDWEQGMTSTATTELPAYQDVVVQYEYEREDSTVSWFDTLYFSGNGNETDTIRINI